MIAVVGSINLDVVAQVERHPHPGETVTARRHFTNHGGKGANQAVAAARLGAEVAMVGAVGTDEAGVELIDALVAETIDVSHVTRVDGPSGMAFITLADDGENSIVVSGAANTAVVLAESERAVIGAASVVLAQCEIPQEAVAAARAATEGVFILNAAPATHLRRDLVATTDVLIVNEHELRSLAGGAEPDAARSLGCGTVVVTLGARGAQVITPADIGYVPAPPVTARDTTGAGDAFCGAFAVAIAEGQDVFEAATWGVAAGSFATTGIGARSSPNRDQLVRTMRSGT